MQANQLEHEADEFCKIIKEIASEPDDANRLVLEKALADKSETAHILQVGTYIVLNEKYHSRI